jgi:hypothetical protein
VYAGVNDMPHKRQCAAQWHGARSIPGGST